MRVIFRSGTSGLAAEQASTQIIAVDMGFSSSKASCGLAWKGFTVDGTSVLTFGNCVSRTLELVKAADSSVLILEAPLSGFLSAQLNPIARESVEYVEATPSAPVQRRYWYCNAGASTCLSALIFLHELKRRLEATDDRSHSLQITVYEGFLSFKEMGTDHGQDAQLILDAFCAGGAELLSIEPKDKFRTINILSMIDADVPGNPLPLLVKPSKERLERAAALPWVSGLHARAVMTDEASLWLQNLKALGQSQGYLTYAQVNESLPLAIVHPEKIEEIVEQLNRSGIRIVPG